MIIDTSKTIAYSVHPVARSIYQHITLWNVKQKRKQFTCRCNGSSLVIAREGLNDYRIVIPCIGCGTDHIYLFGRKELVSGEIHVLNCPKTGMQQCFIGNDEDVGKNWTALEKEFDELIDTLGYDNYFVNHPGYVWLAEYHSWYRWKRKFILWMWQ